ncbi:metal transporter CNNM3 isoform X2 [Emydura macquarii macquarii]|uniref:metal transporter CNNM3 isoform X2 n=1 Tax=Emydura macquarii macquarii TaxID=1129001 RepID=UPI00352B26EB
MAGGWGLRWALAALSLVRAGAGAGTGPPAEPPPRVLGFRLEEEGGAWARGGLVRAAPGSSFRLRLYGTGLRNRSWPWLAFAPAGEPCLARAGLEPGPDPDPEPGPAPAALRVLPEPEAGAGGEHAALVRVAVARGGARGRYQLCSRLGPGQPWGPAAPGDAVLVAEGEGPGPAAPALAPGLLALVLALLLALSGLLRALQLSTLALEPLGQRGPWALCSLLLLGTLANAALAVLAYWATRAVVPAILAVAGLVFLLAEVLPVAVSWRWGQALAARCRWLTRLCMLLTFPVSLPLGKLLEWALRCEAGTRLLREKILEAARGSDPYNEFVREEFSKGALRDKTVEDVLTPLAQCFVLSADAVLDFHSMSTIMQSGYTRIPVYEEERTNLVDMLYVKDLALVDPDDRVPLSTIIKFYNHPLHFVFNDTKLDEVLEEFKRGKSHLAIVQKVNNEGEGDPFYEAVGLVTLEDVIEEIIKSEILDESDDYKENKVRKKLPPAGTLLEHRKEEFSLFKASDDEYKVKISPQLLLATQRFLSREVDLFSPARVSEKVLLHMLKHPSVNQEVKFNESDRLDPQHYLYQRNQPVNYFVLVLQGRVEVEIGKEGLKFENGAFTYYGVSALTAPSSVHQSPVSTLRPSRREQPLDGSESNACSAYCPDYTVRALTDLQFVKVTRLQYLNALMASRIQTSPQSPDGTELKVVPSSQMKLPADRSTVAGKGGQALGEEARTGSTTDI